MEDITEIGPYYYKKYKDEYIGQGSFGTVYKCYNRYDPKLPLCVKVTIFIKQQIIKWSKKPRKREKQKIEINILNHLRQFAQTNKNLILMHEFYQNDQGVQIVMEKCDFSLYDLQKNLKSKEFTPEQALSIISQISNGYRTLIQNNILHRDIKPQNILYDRNNNTFKLIDFGLSRFQDINSNHSAKGTPEFISPQVFYKSQGIAEGQYTNKADMYSLGITFYYLIFGNLPYKVNDESQLFQIFENFKVNPFKIQVTQQNDPNQEIYSLIESMLRIHEKDRISWEELFGNQLIVRAPQFNLSIYQVNQNQQSAKFQQENNAQQSDFQTTNYNTSQQPTKQSKTFNPFILLQQLDFKNSSTFFWSYAVGILYYSAVELYYQFFYQTLNFQNDQLCNYILMDLLESSQFYFQDSLNYFNQELDGVAYQQNVQNLQEKLHQVIFHNNQIYNVILLNSQAQSVQQISQQSNQFQSSEMYVYRNNLQYFLDPNQQYNSLEYLRLIYLLEQLNELSQNRYQNIMTSIQLILKSIQSQEDMHNYLRSKRNF